MSTSSATANSAQPRPRTDFLCGPADSCIYGGATGDGKIVGLILAPLILAPLRHVRRDRELHRGLPAHDDADHQSRRAMGREPKISIHEWTGPRTSERANGAGGKIKFSQLQFDSTVYDWQGAQITLICFDELTHFSRHQFFYMVGRNRSTCGVPPYIRATCNPDDSWAADFLAWWIDPETGAPDSPAGRCAALFHPRCGQNRMALRPEDLMQHLPRAEDLPPGFELSRPISVTFIPACVFDNPTLLQVNPEYVSWLRSLPLLEYERLLRGNRKIRPAAGLYFKREWCTMVDEVPADLDYIVRYWDLAATEKTEFNDPDWTVGIKLGRDKNGGYWLLVFNCIE